MRRAYIGIGANLGDRDATLQAAVEAIAGLPATTLVARSSAFESAPLDADGPPYRNAVVAVDTALGAEPLLVALQRIEAAHGRERPYRHAPRTLDLDLLLHGEAALDTATLTLPHPRMHERAFVLAPLIELAPDLVVPGRGRAAALLAALADQGVRRLPAAAPASGLDRYRHIAIEGPIGAGKTTLARILAPRLDAELLLEQPAENPFLERFYADMPGYAMQTQLAFLFQRQKQLAAVAQPEMFARPVVSDFMLAKDAIFARLTLGDDEHRLYTQLYTPLAATLPTPDLVLWLRASPETLLARIRRRGIAMERTIDRAYLAGLSDAYVRHFETSDDAPVLAVDADRFDPGVDADRLLRALSRFAGRRGVFLAADRDDAPWERRDA